VQLHVGTFFFAKIIDEFFSTDIRRDQAALNVIAGEGLVSQIEKESVIPTSISLPSQVIGESLVFRSV
jgi:hypothetical protein